MQCPVDGATLTMSERSGIEIDYCPTCRGVWLDRGELDKIIDRSLETPAAPPAAAAPPPPQQPQYERYDDRRDDRRYDDRDRRYDQRYDPRYDKNYRKKRKESWLSELFD